MTPGHHTGFYKQYEKNLDNVRLHPSFPSSPSKYSGPFSKQCGVHGTLDRVQVLDGSRQWSKCQLVQDKTSHLFSVSCSLQVRQIDKMNPPFFLMFVM
jgi:hypothetical protein